MPGGGGKEMDATGDTGGAVSGMWHSFFSSQVDGKDEGRGKLQTFRTLARWLAKVNRVFSMPHRGWFGFSL